MTHLYASLTVSNEIGEVDRAGDWLQSFADAARVPDDIAAKLHVVLDEVLSNVIRHGLSGVGGGGGGGRRRRPPPPPPPGGGGGGLIGLTLRRKPGAVELVVVDDGPEFDPTRATIPAVALRVAERRPGGAGLLFVRSLMDEIRFARLEGANRTVLRKSVPGEAG